MSDTNVDRCQPSFAYRRSDESICRGSENAFRGMKVGGKIIERLARKLQTD
jgi:hypothetical protein